MLFRSPGFKGITGGVAVQEAFSEMVAGSFSAGDRFGVQRHGPDRVDGHDIPEQAPGQQHVVAELPGALD